MKKPKGIFRIKKEEKIVSIYSTPKNLHREIDGKIKALGILYSDFFNNKKSKVLETLLTLQLQGEGNIKKLGPKNVIYY